VSCASGIIESNRDRISLASAVAVPLLAFGDEECLTTQQMSDDEAVKRKEKGKKKKKEGKEQNRDQERPPV